MITESLNTDSPHYCTSWWDLVSMILCWLCVRWPEGLFCTICLLLSVGLLHSHLAVTCSPHNPCSVKTCTLVWLQYVRLELEWWEWHDSEIFPKSHCTTVWAIILIFFFFFALFVYPCMHRLKVSLKQSSWIRMKTDTTREWSLISSMATRRVGIATDSSFVRKHGSRSLMGISGVV